MYSTYTRWKARSRHGCASGIGRAIAPEFAEYGAEVLVADVRRCGEVDEPTDKILEDKTHGVFVETDVTDRQAMRQTIDTAVDEFGGVDILLNNAGVSAAGSIDGIGFDDWQSIMDVNGGVQLL